MIVVYTESLPVLGTPTKGTLSFLGGNQTIIDGGIAISLFVLVLLRT
jgi:hypothetical protein